jgi:alpha-galactosidase
MTEDAWPPVQAERVGDGFAAAGVLAALHSTDDQLRVHVQASGKLARVALRWHGKFEADSLFLGDHWERGYGDLQWRTFQAERVMPWYFAAHSPSVASTLSVGVMTGSGAMCAWCVDSAGVTLWLDLRNGGNPCVPGDRSIDAATIVALESRAGESPMAVIRRLCQRMCPSPRLPDAPVCGNNNWYYAYGHGFDHHQVRRDAGLLAELAGDHAVRPYCVIDAGWSPGSVCPGGPWTASRPDRFPDMPALAADIRNIGVRPGIWIRPTALTTVDDPKRLRAGPPIGGEFPLDLTLAENLQTIHDDVARMRAWGFDLIKHDFSTYDLFGKWGFEMGVEMTAPSWSFADRSLTNAEIITRLYRTIRTGAGDAVLIGCNTVGHLGAGLFEVQRTGDDTSGKIWERTRRMGVNTLAFRMPQHGTFFMNDADCVAHTERTPWEKDRQFLDAVARSGTALFVSVDPTKIEPDVKCEMSIAMRRALDGGVKLAEPLDWLHTTTPRRWRFDDEQIEYEWDERGGAWPAKC